MSHQFPAADAAKLTVVRRTPAGPLNVVQPRLRGPLVRAAYHSSLFDALATEIDETCGLGR